MTAKILRRLAVAAAALTVLTSAPPPAAAAPAELRLPIVMYHHISPNAALLGKYVVSPEQLENDLRFLKGGGYVSVTAGELEDWCSGNYSMPEKPVMITFDDGYESTWVYARPLLEKYGFRGIVSVIGAVSQQYTDRPDHTLRYSHMDWDEVADAAAGSVLEVECHTWDMHRLSPRRGCGRKKGESSAAYRAALTADLEKFRSVMEERTGKTCGALALPFGFYSRDTLETAVSLGFGVIFTCTEKVNVLTGDPSELTELGRYNRPSGPGSTAFFSKWEEK